MLNSTEGVTSAFCGANGLLQTRGPYFLVDPYTWAVGVLLFTPGKSGDATNGWAVSPIFPLVLALPYQPSLVPDVHTLLKPKISKQAIN